MIDAEYEELDEGAGELGAELDLANTDNLPWLESDEEEEASTTEDASVPAGEMNMPNIEYQQEIIDLDSKIDQLKS